MLPAVRDVVLAELRSAAHLRVVCESYDFGERTVDGLSDRDICALFDDSYRGRFRRRYVRSVLLRIVGVGSSAPDRRFSVEPPFSYFIE